MVKWNVYFENFNKRKIEIYNIFDHTGFVKDLQKTLRKSDITPDEITESIKRSLMYYFWSKCEWEIILSDWPPSDLFNKEKVSVYDQVMLNFDSFVGYILNHKKEIMKLYR